MSQDDFTPRRRSPRSRLDPELAADLDRLEMEMADRRLRIFRAHSARSVCLASPLLIDSCTAFELDEAAWRLRPPPAWPEVAQVDRVIRRPKRWRRRSGGAGGGWSILRLTPRCAHLMVEEPDFMLMTTDCGGRLSLGVELLDVERDAMVGRPLREAHPHRLFQGPYLVQGVIEDTELRRTVVDFAAPPIEWRLPWARPWRLYDPR